MYILQIEHPVRKYEEWKKAFDNDPVGRKRNGVLRYRILRPSDNPDYVMVELEFKSEDEAKQLMAALRELWGKVEGTLIEKAQVRILYIAEDVEV